MATYDSILEEAHIHIAIGVSALSLAMRLAIYEWTTIDTSIFQRTIHEAILSVELRS